jgi:pyridoxamine 5'-phosphate oxidase
MPLQARQKMWNSLSPAARQQFAWPHPGLPVVPGGEEAAEEAAPGAHEPPLSPFCLVIAETSAVDYLSLKGNRRLKFAKVVGDGSWTQMEVNP